MAGGVAISDDGSFGGGTSTGVTSRLEYTRIEHAGGAFLMGDDFAVAKEDEGSLWLRGVKDVSNVDVLSHVQIHNSGGQGLSLTGGDVNLKHLLLTGGVYKPLLRAFGGYIGTVAKSVLQRYPSDVSRSMVEVGGFEGGDTTFLTLENITAVAFDDAYDNRDPAPALLFSSGGAGIHVFDSLFHLGDGVTGQRVIDGIGIAGNEYHRHFKFRYVVQWFVCLFHRQPALFGCTQ